MKKVNEKNLDPKHPLYYAANYFFKAEGIIKHALPDAITTLQFFQRGDDAMLAGMEEVLELLEKYTDTSKYKIKYLEDGTIINSMDIVLELEGKYEYFGTYEGIIDSILARATSVATNIRHCIKAAGKKEIIFMSDRSDHYSNQIRDGKAAILAGIKAHPTTATSQNRPELVFGSIPHVLIQAFEGDVVKAMLYYKELYPEDDYLVALVDFNNDVISDSLKVLEALKGDLKAVRVDTSKSVMDKMFNESDKEFGVTVRQIKNLRKSLDANGGEHVKIVVSSGFTPTRIAEFEAQNAPVDSYGVGEYILEIKNHFSADAVKINGKHLAKVGRFYRDSSKLKVYGK
ncbi:nicotinate phosphoribosyltransferase [Mycoplasmopsis agassizii]|uniref:nicotinate phosphoribosyltransferase n=1 Tax=Mycoplasmopsis agassizii TaxID=33922 RepID=A0ABX4H5D1_9BACT|nr:nicotinate phosphoribosyltransferase [Mycoplasmopsis agassizii]PAF55106.1 nicotinate phosphoribosyltransferase [Mycoplasmopsis agassizii]SMC16517.1 nicotinate phosphoribosyltransferase [Mycoplasmopsis agassizii]